MRGEFRKIKHMSYARSGENGFVLPLHFRGGLRSLLAKQSMKLRCKHRLLPGNTSSAMRRRDEERHEASEVCFSKPVWATGGKSQWVTLRNSAEHCSRWEERYLSNISHQWLVEACSGWMVLSSPL